MLLGEWQLGVPTAKWVGMPHGMPRFFSVFSLVSGFNASDRILVINEWSAAFSCLSLLFCSLACHVHCRSLSIPFKCPWLRQALYLMKNSGEKVPPI